MLGNDHLRVDGKSKNLYAYLTCSLGKKNLRKSLYIINQTDRESEAIFIEAVGWQNLLQFQVKELLESTLAALSAR